MPTTRDRFKASVRSIPVIGPVARRLYLWTFGAGGLADQFRYIRHGVLGDHWVSVEIDGTPFEFRCATVTETRRAVVSTRRERAVLAELRDLCLPGMVVFDVGANVGTHSLALADVVGPDGTVICFEPHSKTFEALVANISRNGFENIVTKHKALGATTETAKLYVEHDDPGVGSHSLIRRTEDIETAEEIDVIRGDEFVKDQGYHPDLMKIDVEGGELDVLQGLTETLREDKPLLVVEVHDVVDFESVREFLRDRDYAISQSEAEKDIIVARLE